MLNALTPLSIGAAATAIGTVAGAIPTPGEFAAALQQAGERTKGQSRETAPAGVKSASVWPIHSRESRTEMRRLLHDAEKALARLLARHDVDASKPIRLKLDASGAVRAEADHPDAAKIDQLLSTDVQLSSTLATLLRSTNAATSPELLGNLSASGAATGEPAITFLDGALTASLA